MIGIYKITNPKGKIYIGQSIDIEKRIKSYKTINCKFQILLYNSISKYSWEKHMFEIIEECSLEQLNEKEIYWGTYYNVLNKGLNLRLGNGKGVVSEETKQKQREAKLGHKQSKETIEKRSKTLKNIPKPEGFGEKHSLLMKGKSKPKDFGEKISKAKKGIPLPLGTGDKISKSRSKQVIQLDKNNQIINTFLSVKEASKYIKVHEINMRLHIGGKYKTCRGYIFKYKNND
jgi:group I intron endonuclease